MQDSDTYGGLFLTYKNSGKKISGENKRYDKICLIH